MAAFPATGAANTIYIALDTNTLYRWTGSAYSVVSASPEEVIEAANLAAFPATGEAGKLYVAIDTGLAYRWTGSVYVEISAAPVQSVAGKTGAVTLAKGDVGLGNVDNTSDASKPVSTATQAALDGKAAASHGHDAATTSAAGFLSAADKSKLDGIATGATANATDAQLRDRSTHTGTQTANTISDFAAAVVAAAPPTTDASLLTSGTLAAARIGSHAASHQTGGADAINPVIVTPASLSTSQNDYAPGSCDIIRMSSATAVDITGLLSPSVDGAMRLVINTNASGGAAITLRHESTSSTAANRFRNTTGGDFVLPADGGSAVLTYSSAILRWRIL